MSNSFSITLQEKLSRYFWTVLGLVLMSRLLLMAFLPLNDTTEARYGEIARKMVETNNWVTLFHDYQVPFWAKPPLSTWSSALSAKFLGMTPFALRLPSFLFSLAILALVWAFAKRYAGKTAAQLTALLLASDLYFYIDAGTVMTDPSLLFASTLAMVAFWFRMQGEGSLWGMVFFIALGLGLLAKGPLILVLSGMPIFLWVLLFNQWRSLWLNLPWFKGSLLMLAIALPWYLLAEHRTPGFLNYFIVGEHLGRYLNSGWQGDKYGFAHSTPLGMIWVYTLVGLCPWLFYFVVGFFRERKQIHWQGLRQKPLMMYLLLWALWPLVFFSFSRNIIYTYAFTPIPALIPLLVFLWKDLINQRADLNWIFGLSGLVVALSLVLVALNLWAPASLSFSEKPVVQMVQQQAVAGKRLIYWSYTRKFSAEFYSSGQVSYVTSGEELAEALRKYPGAFLVIDKEDLYRVPSDLLSRFKEISQFRIHDNDELLLASVNQRTLS